MAILEVSNLKKIYTTRFGGNQVQALKNINFSVEEGEYVAIMGESGSGKTTSCRNLDPSTTYYIDCDKKGLNWKGWRDQYNAAANNYKQTNFPSIVLGILKISRNPIRQSTLRLL